MITLIKGESLRVPATVDGDRNLITSIEAVIKKSARGEVPLDTAAVVAAVSVVEFDSVQVPDGYMFTLVNTSALLTGIYYLNYKYIVGGLTYKGDPMKIVVKESVL